MLNHQPYKVTTLAGHYDLLSLVDLNKTDYPFYIESSSQNMGRDVNGASYDILFAFPQEYLVKNSDESVEYAGKTLANTDFLSALDRLYLASKQEYSADNNLPFCGGWFLFLGYELVNEIEPTLVFNEFDPSLPIAFAARVPAAIIYSHKTDQTHVVVESEYHQQYMQKIILDLNSLSVNTTPPALTPLNQVIESPADDYKRAIHKVLAYIKEGDVFQVNLSRLWQSKLNNDISAIDLFKRLRKTNPAPFSALVNYAESSIISSSPERLVKVKQSSIETRPIAGTRPRNTDNVKDDALQSELKTNNKERAEHIMLIDLERNDLGRICEYGSVRVDEFMVIESYAHVHHIVSNVVGTLSQDIKPGQIIKAVFPGGTITGCPKVRCMEIILELENRPRGAYTGSLGYLDRNGDMDLNILIRTFTKNKNEIVFRAGGGIVADSDPERELEETRSKAKGLLLALQG